MSSPSQKPKKPAVAVAAEVGHPGSPAGLLDAGGARVIYSCTTYTCHRYSPAVEQDAHEYFLRLMGALDGDLGYLGDGSAPECFSGFEAETVCFCKTSCFNDVFFCNPQYLSYTSLDFGQLSLCWCMQYFCAECLACIPPPQSNVFTAITVLYALES